MNKCANKCIDAHYCTLPISVTFQRSEVGLPKTEKQCAFKCHTKKKKLFSGSKATQLKVPHLQKRLQQSWKNVLQSLILIIEGIP